MNTFYPVVHLAASSTPILNANLLVSLPMFHVHQFLQHVLLDHRALCLVLICPLLRGNMPPTGAFWMTQMIPLHGSVLGRPAPRSVSNSASQSRRSLRLPNPTQLRLPNLAGLMSLPTSSLYRTQSPGCSVSRFLLGNVQLSARSPARMFLGTLNISGVIPFSLPNPPWVNGRKIAGPHIGGLTLSWGSSYRLNLGATWRQTGRSQ